jgi:signal transduction histidine kinase
MSPVIPTLESMTTGTPVPARPSVLSRALAGGWSTGLFLIGGVLEICAVVNVPGGWAPSADGQLTVTNAGAVWALLGILGWVAVYCRRRAPLVPLIAGAVMLLIGTSYLLFLIGVFEALRAWPGRTRLIRGVAVGGVALYVMRDALTPWGGALPWFLNQQSDGGSSAPWTIAVLVIAALSLTVVFLLSAYTRSRGDVDATRRRADREKQRADSLSDELVRQEERQRIARDMHDTLAHSLGRVTMQAGALEATAENTSPELAGRARTVQELVRAAMVDLRAVLGDLRGEPAHELAAGAPMSMRSIGGLLRELRAAGVPLDAYVLVDDVDRALPALDAAVFRIVQESLTNALKHAPGARVTLHLEASAATGVRIRVTNPVVPGAAAGPGTGHGTVGMRERVAALGGEAWVGEHDGEFIVDVTLPWAGRG